MKNFNKMVSNIINEAVKSNELKTLIKDNLNYLTKDKQRYQKVIFNNAFRLAAPLLGRYYSAKLEDEFYEFLCNEKKKYTGNVAKQLIQKYISLYVPSKAEQFQLLMKLDDNKHINALVNETIDFTDETMIDKSLQLVLSQIDAANISDDDIIVLKDDDIKTFNRAKRGQYQYVICCQNGRILGVVLFQEDGTINYIVHNFYWRRGKVNVSELLSASNKIYCIKYNTIENSRINKLNPRRTLTIRDKSNNPDEINKFDKNANKARYRDYKYNKKETARKDAAKIRLQEALSNAKAVAIKAKAIITDDDIFSTTAEENMIFNTYNKLINAYRECVRVLNSNYLWESEAKRAIDNLTINTNKLNELLKGLNNA